MTRSAAIGRTRTIRGAPGPRSGHPHSTRRTTERPRSSRDALSVATRCIMQSTCTNLVRSSFSGAIATAGRPECTVPHSAERAPLAPSPPTPASLGGNDPGTLELLARCACTSLPVGRHPACAPPRKRLGSPQPNSHLTPRSKVDLFRTLPVPAASRRMHRGYRTPRRRLAAHVVAVRDSPIASPNRAHQTRRSRPSPRRPELHGAFDNSAQLPPTIERPSRRSEATLRPKAMELTSGVVRTRRG